MKLLILFLLFCGAMALNQGKELEKKSELNEGATDEESVTEDRELSLSSAEKPSGTWQQLNDESFVFYSTPATWAHAHMQCLTLGGHLVVINNEEEETFVKGLAKGKEIWIGLSDAQKNGYWFWINSEPLGYTNWCHGEPNNKFGKEHCGITNYKAQKCWNDIPCSNSYPYVCERN